MVSVDVKHHVYFIIFMYYLLVQILAPLILGVAVRIYKTAHEEGIRGEWLAHSSGMNTIVLLVQILYD